MDELILQRIAPGLYATAPVTEDAGFVFLPESDPEMSSLTLVGDVTAAGRWLAWSNGPLATDLSQVAHLLLSSNHRIVFSRGPYGGAVPTTGARLGIISDNDNFITTLSPEFPTISGAQIDQLPMLIISASRLVISNEALMLRSVPGESHFFSREGVSTSVDGLRLVARGTRSGCFVFEIGLYFDDLSLYGLQSVVTAEGRRGLGPTVTSLREERPLFHAHHQPSGDLLPITGVFDPMDGGDPDRFQLVPQSGLTLRSRFQGVHSHDVLLTVPVAGTVPSQPRFRLVLNRDKQDATGKPIVYRASFMPEGPFDLDMAMPEQPKSVDTWITGLAVGDTPHEFLRVGIMVAGKSRRLTFRLGAGHVLPNDPSDPSEAVLISGAQPFEDVTLWAKVEDPGRISVRSAFISEAKALRQLERTPAGTSATLLREHDPRPLPGAVLGDDQGYVPILPAATATSPATDVPVPALLSAARRRAAMPKMRNKIAFLSAEAELPLPPIRPDTRVTTAGFEIREDAQNNVREIIFARGAWNDQVEGRVSVVGKPNEYDPNTPGLVPADLTAAILRNQLFMALDPKIAFDVPVQEFEVRGQIAISGWGFSIEPLGRVGAEARSTLQSASKDAMLLFKGYEGLSIRQLMQDINLKLWSGKRFVKDPRVAAQRVLELYERINDEKLSKDPRYDALRAALDDPGWNGVLVLDMAVDPSNLPTQIKGLMGGIDKDRLQADHIGFPVQRLRDQSSSPRAKPFAAVTYESKPLEPDASEDYQFNVQNLLAGFAAGNLQSFSCKLELRVGQLFGDDKLKLTKNGSNVETNVITLDGSYERRQEAGKSVEVYKFLSNDDYSIKMWDNFPLIDTLMVDEISYSPSLTQYKHTDGSVVDRVEGRFRLDGDFTPKEGDIGVGRGIDFFDFEKVKFSDLGIDINFDIDAGGGIRGPFLSFSPGALEFDFASGEPKGDGFFSSFPLKWKSFGLLSGGLKLPDIDFISMSGGSGGPPHTPFFLIFDLDLGNFGSLGAALKDFRMELALGFGLDSGRPVLDLGLRFPSSPPGSLDIGFQGVLELKARRYELVQLKYTMNSEEEGKAWGFRGVGVELKVFNVTLPPGDATSGVYIFADPANLDAGVGWLLSTVAPESDGSINLKLLTIGQRIDPLPGIDTTGQRISTQVVLNQFAKLAEGENKPGMPVKTDPDSDQVEEVSIPPVVYDPRRDWTIAFDLELFDYLGFGLAIRDPDLAGLRVAIAELFDIDVLYRKLSEDLGVYSAEVALAENLRHWQFGAAGITIPIIAFDVYTNGDWGVDLGYPHNKDFTRAFHLNVLPFTGAGGFVFRRVSGPGAKLLPATGALKGGGTARYDPITEVQLGARVGLGVAVGGGMFRAGLSLTVYLYLTGAHGRLRVPGGETPEAAPSYILVEGIVGIMGELYGYVDFGIVRAGVHITLWVEAGVRFETDRALRLHYEVGVRVRISVEIARICVWRKCWRISVSFSFSTQVRIEQTVGRDRRHPYDDAIVDKQKLQALRALTSLRSDESYWNQWPAPADWGAGSDPVQLLCVLQPDVTLAFDALTGTPEPQAVMLLAIELSERAKGKQPADPISPAEELVRGLTAWAIKANTTDQTALSATVLRVIAARIAGDAGAQEDNTLPLRPDATSISLFLSEAFAATAVDLPERGTESALREARGALIPLPSQLKVKRDAEVEFTLDLFNFVTPDYLARVTELTKNQLLAELGEGAPGAAAQSVADVMTQEWVALVMRGALGKLADHLDTLPPPEPGGAVALSLSELMTWLGAAHDIDMAETTQLRSPAAEVAMQAGRSLIAGPRIPIPETGTWPDWLESAPQGAEADWFHPLYRLGGMQFPIDPEHGPMINAGQYGWLSVPQTLDFESAEPSALVALKAAADQLEREAQAKQVALFNTHLARSPLLRSRPRHVRLGALGLSDALEDATGASSPRPLWPLDELRAEFDEMLASGVDPLKSIKRIRRSDTQPNTPLTYIDLEPGELSTLVPAMVLDLSVSPASDQTSAGAMAPTSLAGLTIQAMEERARALLDTALDDRRPEAPEVSSVRLYLVRSDGTTGAEIGAASRLRPFVVKTNPSREVTPASALETLRATARSVVPASEGAAFLELIRQAVIVNTGGFTVFVPKDDLPAPSRVEAQNPLQAGLRLRIVAELGAQGQRAGLAASNDARLLFANRLIGAPGTWPRETVLAADMGPELYPLHQPGVLPVAVTRDPPPESPDEVALLAQRFSTASFELALDGKVILGRDRSVAVQSDPEEQPDDGAHQVSAATAAKSSLRYRAALAVGQLNGNTASFVDARAAAEEGQTRPVTLYDLVGKSVSTSVHWRDVYGNLWGNAAVLTRDITMPYCDRVIGLVGLPFLRLVQMPEIVNEAFGLQLAFSFDLAAVKAAMGEGKDPQQLGLAANTLQRAAAQLRDTRVTLELGLGAQAKSVPALLNDARKQEIITLLDAMAVQVSNAANGINPTSVTLKSFSVTVPLPAADTPVEYTVSLTVKRTSPKDAPALYPIDDARGALPDDFTEDAILAALEPFFRIEQDVPMATDSTPEPQPAETDLAQPTRPSKPLDAYLDALEEAVEGSFRVATGRSGRALGGTGAIWLVPRPMLDKITGDQLKTRDAIPHAFRPLRNRRISVDFGGAGGVPAISQPPGKPLRAVRVVDADVDLEARRIIDYLERLNDPQIIAAAVETEASDTRKLDGFVAACQELRRTFAKLLVDSQLAPVLIKDLASTELKQQMRDRVSDRLSRDLTRFDTTGGFLLLPETGVQTREEGATVHGELIFNGGDAAAENPSEQDESAAATPAIQTFSLEIGASTFEDRRSDLLLSFPVQTGSILARPPAGLRITHLQAAKRVSAGGPNADYRPTAWLKLHDRAAGKMPQNAFAAWSRVELAKEPRAVIPIRRVPKAPVLIGERFLPATLPGGTPPNLRTLRQWTAQHWLDIGPVIAQDRLTCRVTYSDGSIDRSKLQSAAGAAEETLALRLLRFGEEIREVPVEDIYFAAGKYGVRTWLLERLQALVAPLRQSELSSQTAPPRDEITVVERKTRNQNGIETLSVTIERTDEVAPDAKWILGQHDPSSALEVPTKDAGRIEYPDRPLPAAQLRGLELAGLDAMVHADAVSEHWIDRNRSAGGDDLHPDFIYTTARVGSGEPVTPVLDHRAQVLLGDQIALKPSGFVNDTALRGQLHGILEALLGGAHRALATDIVIEYETDVFLGQPGGPIDQWRESGGPLILAVTGFRGTDSHSLDELAAKITGKLSEWERSGPVRDAQNRPIGRLVFDFRIYNATQSGEGYDDTRVLWLRRGVLSLPGEL